LAWQTAAGNLVTPYKTYHSTYQGEFLGIPATGKQVSFYTVDAMRVVDGKITEHWGCRDAARPDAAARRRSSSRTSNMTTPIGERVAGETVARAV
jgi:predicted SnoaL-like aldol condensation-catalyzing enzyme